MLEVRDRRKQTYFNSAVWAAMRVRSDLSARGQPDRLEDRLEREHQKKQTENKMSEYEWRKEPEPELDYWARTGLGTTHREDRTPSSVIAGEERFRAVSTESPKLNGVRCKWNNRLVLCFLVIWTDYLAQTTGKKSSFSLGKHPLAKPTVSSIRAVILHWWVVTWK